jgi:hypothetical protein
MYLLERLVSDYADKTGSKYAMGFGHAYPEYMVVLPMPYATFLSAQKLTKSLGWHMRIVRELIRLGGLRIDGPSANTWITFAYKIHTRYFHKQFDFHKKVIWNEHRILDRPRIITVGTGAWRMVAGTAGKDAIFMPTPVFHAHAWEKKRHEEAWLTLGEVLRKG